MLEKIQKPNDIKKIPADQLPALAEEIREFIIESLSKTGGHLASNLGVVELTIAMHRVFDLPKDKLIWDVGHQSYTHKILTGRKDGFETLRREGGISGFPKRSESDCDVFDTGHSSTSISAGVGYVRARELKKENYSVVSIIGDGALPGGEVRDEVLRAGGIVIATGGFTADVGRRLLYDDRLTVDVPTTANPQGLYFDGATGDGLDLGAMVGGHTVGMSNIILLPYAGGRLLDYVGGDIYVNSSGERFMNEEMPIYDISEAILAQAGRTCWVITDSRSRKGGTLGLKLADGTVRRSNTIEEMARAMDVPVNTLRRTISEYNEDVAKGLDRRFGKRIFTQAIDSPPYYWGREAVYVHMTLGGLAVSPEARLLDRRGMPIPGFWAAGETTGGIFGRGRPGGMSLITCLVQGRDAGRAAAERSLALKPKAKKVEK